MKRVVISSSLALALSAPALAADAPEGAGAPPPPPPPPSARFAGGVGAGDLLWMSLLFGLTPDVELLVGTGLSVTWIGAARVDARLAAVWTFAPADGTPWSTDTYLFGGPVRTIVGGAIVRESSSPPGAPPAESWAVEAGIGWSWGGRSTGLRLEALGRADLFDTYDPREVRLTYTDRWLVSPGVRLGFDTPW